MKYMQNGGFQSQSLMKLTLIFTLLFLTAFWATNFAMYFSRMGLSSASVQSYYLGSETDFTMPRTFGSMLEVTHAHLAMMAVVLLLLTHLLIFVQYSFRSKAILISASFMLALINESAGWLVRFVDPAFAALKVAGFVGFQCMLGFLLGALALFLLRNKRAGKNGASHGGSREAAGGDGASDFTKAGNLSAQARVS